VGIAELNQPGILVARKAE
jgi:hypothetical protein